ncbi:MAG: hypothetical protein ACOYM9_18055 [Bradymonadia bacterium]
MKIIPSNTGIANEFDRLRPESTDYRLSVAVIVGPYVARDFVTSFQDAYQPERLFLVVDDGWPVLELHDLPGVTIVRVAPSNRAGLFHAKMYYARWIESRRQGEMPTRGKGKPPPPLIDLERLAWGSANASMSAFERHAETLAVCELDLLEDRESQRVRQYFDSIIEQDTTNEVTVRLGNNTTLYLPEVRRVDSDSFYSFDGWLRSGRLCHKFERDQQFGKFRIKLAKPLEQSVVDKVFASGGWARESQRDSFSWPYVRIKKNGSPERERWRARYFVETPYGYWTSAACFRDLGERFVSQDADQVSNLIEEVANSVRNSAQKTKWLRQFGAGIERLEKRVRKVDSRTEKYFHFQKVIGKARAKSGPAQPILDLKRYMKHAEAKLEADVRKANLEAFQRRMAKGFVFYRVPNLAGDMGDFAVQFCESVLKAMQGQRTPNRIAYAIQSFLRKTGNDAGELSTGVELLELLRDENVWRDIAGLLSSFHEDDQEVGSE